MIKQSSSIKKEDTPTKLKNQGKPGYLDKLLNYVNLIKM